MPLEPKQQPPYYTPGTAGTNTNKFTRINTQLTTEVTSGTNETDLYTYTIPANSLLDNGDTLDINFAAIYTENAQNHILKFYIDGTAVITRLDSANGQAVAKIRIIRTATTTALIQGQLWTENNFFGEPTIQIQATIDFNNTIPIKFTGQCTTPATIQTYYMTIDKIKL